MLSFDRIDLYLNTVFFIASNLHHCKVVGIISWNSASFQIIRIPHSTNIRDLTSIVLQQAFPMNYFNKIFYAPH